MKHVLVYIALILLTNCKIGPNNTDISKLSNLPIFKIMSLDSSKYINTQELPKGKVQLFIYFGPNCDVCKKEITDLLLHLDKLKHVDIYMISNESSDANNQFRSNFCIDTAKNIFIGNDYDNSFYKVFRPPGTPFIAIYDRDKKLVKIYKEKVAIRSIINAVSSTGKLY